MAPKKVSYPRWLNECPNLWWYNPYEIPSSRFLSPWLISRRHTMAACWNYHGSQPTWLGQDFSETNPHRSSNNRKPQDSSNVHVQRPLNLGNVGTTATTTTIHNKPPLFPWNGNHIPAFKKYGEITGGLVQMALLNTTRLWVSCHISIYFTWNVEPFENDFPISVTVAIMVTY